MRELQGRWPGFRWGRWEVRGTVFSRQTGSLWPSAGAAMRGMAREYAAGNSRGPTDVPPAKAAQEGPEGGCGALTAQPRTPAVPPARSASASSMQSPPASAVATRRWSSKAMRYGRDCSVAASVGCSLFPGGFLFQNHYPRFGGSPLRFLQGLSPRPSFGGFGLKQLEVTAVS